MGLNRTNEAAFLLSPIYSHLLPLGTAVFRIFFLKVLPDGLMSADRRHQMSGCTSGRVAGLLKGFAAICASLLILALACSSLRGFLEIFFQIIRQKGNIRVKGPKSKKRLKTLKKG